MDVVHPVPTRHPLLPLPTLASRVEAEGRESLSWARASRHVQQRPVPPEISGTLLKTDGVVLRACARLRAADKSIHTMLGTPASPPSPLNHLCKRASPRPIVCPATFNGLLGSDTGREVFMLGSPPVGPSLCLPVCNRNLQGKDRKKKNSCPCALVRPCSCPSSPWMLAQRLVASFFPARSPRLAPALQ